ncbi:carbohydrate sulfotransferase 9-like [Centrocercus urophasianus]|uniref:carbohydrate sulfotransferase 9-like n=1 Tax=Centrocercus urophasianus TaxID=9002 RepID=UPI001C64CE73|nr:carbohydrate sulfotransferase 9-like [Centrocercus urophasianus]
MRFLLRIIIVATLGITILVTWRLLWTPGGDMAPKAEEDFTLTLDTFLHVQQLRKKSLRAFCSRSGKATMLQTSREERAHLLSRVKVSTKLNFLYCQVPATGVEGWQQLLEELEEKENGTLPAPLPYPQQHTLQTELGRLNLSTIEAVIGSYTKVLFVRDPFQRLVAAYLQSMHRSSSFNNFVQEALDTGMQNAGTAWKPLVSLCLPCLIQYDYVLMFGFLRQELGHLLQCTRLKANTHLLELTDQHVLWTYSWLSKKLLSELSLQQKQQLAHFFRWDLSAFPFSHSLLSDHLSTPESL